MTTTKTPRIPALTKTQIDYATKRVDAILHTKYVKAVEKLGPAPQQDKADWSRDEQLDMIRCGMATMHKKVDHYCRVTECFDYPPKPVNRTNQVLVEKYRKAVAALDAARKQRMQKLLDQLHLSGDASAVLALIESLANE